MSSVPAEEGNDSRFQGALPVIRKRAADSGTARSAEAIRAILPQSGSSHSLSIAKPFCLSISSILYCAGGLCKQNSRRPRD